MTIELNIKREAVKTAAEWTAVLAKATILGCSLGCMEAMFFPKHWRTMHLPLTLTTMALTMTPRDCKALCDNVDDVVDYIFDKIEKN